MSASVDLLNESAALTRRRNLMRELRDEPRECGAVYRHLPMSAVLLGMPDTKCVRQAWFTAATVVPGT